MSFRLFGKGLACLIFYMIADAGIEMNNYSILEDCIRDTFSRVVWSHKIQEKQADIYQSQYTVLMVVNIFSSSLTSAGIVSLLWFDELYIKIISALLSFVTVSVSAYIKQFNLNTMVKSHKSTATKLLAARDELTCLLMKCRLQDMVKMLELLKWQGYERASLAVQKENYAVKMYKNVGFKTVDENAEEYIMVCEL